MRALAVLTLALCALTACSGGQALKLLTGGGPNVAANVQAGKTNSQTIGTTHNTDQKIIRPQARTIRQHNDRNSVQADSVEQVVVNEGPPWALVYGLAALCVLLLFLPRIDQIWKSFWAKRNKGNSPKPDHPNT